MDIDKIQEIAESAWNEPKTHQFPPEVKNRMLHADADVFSYKACDLDYTYAQNVQTLKELIQVWRKLAGAEFVKLHLTMGNKGGREEIAKVKKYQGNRSKQDHDKQERVADLREWMMNITPGKERMLPFANFDQEADDSMTQAMHESLKDGRDDVLFTVDKDLWMVPGKHLNPKTLEIDEYPDNYGRCYLTVDGRGKKKLVGMGTSWFWHQMLMGDQADNVPGLPMMTKGMWIKHAPTKAIADVNRRLASGRHPSGSLMTTEQRRKYTAKYSELYEQAQDKKIGQVLAHKYLENCLSDHMAYKMVREAYEDWYGSGEYSFYSWDNTLIQTDAFGMMLEQGRLLWMRRTIGEDVMTWWKSLES